MRTYEYSARQQRGAPGANPVPRRHRRIRKPYLRRVLKSITIVN